MSVKFQKEKYFENIGIKPNMDKEEEIKLLEGKLLAISKWIGPASLDARNNIRAAEMQHDACTQRLYELGAYHLCTKCKRYVQVVDAHGEGLHCHIR